MLKAIDCKMSIFGIKNEISLKNTGSMNKKHPKSTPFIVIPYIPIPSIRYSAFLNQIGKLSFVANKQDFSITINKNGMFCAHQKAYVTTIQSHRVHH
jgi:hypothetical protein